ncbi:hypothetical protein CLU79DRAFT_704870 [Phycomyces nitens]|nr:hypothetical protein CLU79DRAFT_704870 [Phycomyces nitens]
MPRLYLPQQWNQLKLQQHPRSPLRLPQSPFWKLGSCCSGKPTTIFNNVAAKSQIKQHNANKLWISSNEDNTVVFDITHSGLDASQFFQALKAQYPSDVPHACTEGVVVQHQTFLDTPTLGGDSKVLHVYLDKLPLCHSQKLELQVKEVLGQYDQVIHIGLYMDLQFKLFGGKSFVILDTLPVEEVEYLALSHKIDF